MKKIITTLLSLLIIFGLLTAGAATDNDMTMLKAFEVPSAELLGAESLISFRMEPFGKSGIMAPDGSTLIPNKYLWLEIKNPFGYVVASKLDELNGKGLLDLSGNELVPFAYGEIQVLSQDWVMALKLVESTKESYDYQALFGGFGSGYYLIENRDFYNLSSKEMVGTLSRLALDNIYVYTGFLQIEDPDDKVSVYDDNLQLMGTADKVYYGFTVTKAGDVCEVRRNGDGLLLFTSTEEVTAYNNKDNTFDISRDGKKGRLNSQGNLMFAPGFSNLYHFDGDYIRAKETYDGKMGLLDQQGKVIVDFLYDDIVASHYRGINVGPETQIFVNGYAPVMLDGKVGFINQQGQQTVAPSYPESAVKTAANTLLASNLDGTFTLVAADGQVTTLPYQTAEMLFNGIDGRLIQVSDDKGQVGIVDWHGNIVVPFGPYSAYGNKTSSKGDLLLMDNRETRMVEVYALQQ